MSFFISIHHLFIILPNVTKVIIPDRVTTIVYGAFYNCTSLTSIKIHSTVQTIDYSAFDGCTNLVIYCEPTVAPEGWYGVNGSDYNVVWGYIE